MKRISSVMLSVLLALLFTTVAYAGTSPATGDNGIGTWIVLMVVAVIVLIGVVYVLVRCIGKYYGARFSAAMTNCSQTVRKYLGITLFPQAGVALGMCTLAMGLGEQGSLIRNITLFAILIYELVGPLMTRDALTKAGDITEKSDEVKNRRAIRLSEVLGQDAKKIEGKCGKHPGDQ